MEYSEVEDLHELDLFVKPATEPQDASASAEQGGGGGGGGSAIGDEPRRYAVKAGCAEKINRLLDVRRYHRRWPKIPVHELYASSVQHPHVPEWRWVLNTRRVPSMQPGPDGAFPKVPACRDCAYCLSANTPKKVEMPRYALADDKWIGRTPFPFTPAGEPLSEMTVKTLARGRNSGG